MQTLRVIGVSCLVLAAGACQPALHPRAVTRLTCEKAEGGLRLQSAAADGKSCLYRTADGAEVQLRLVPVSGGAAATLKAVEAEVLALAATPAAKPPGAVAPSPASAAVEAEQAATVAQAEADAAASDTAEEASDDVQLDMPGVHIRTRGESANIKVGGLRVEADAEGAVVRWIKDVRLKGEATSFEKRGVRALFILAGPDGPEHVSAGYQAGGPKAGPLTVALIKWGWKDQEDLFDDVDRLVRRNGGV